MSDDLESLEESAGGLSALIEPIKKFGVGKLILLLLVFGFLAWFFVLAPKPAKLTVIVQEIDNVGDEGIAGALVAVEVPGQKEQTLFTNENGVASFKDLPSKVKLSVRVDPPESFDPTSKEVQMESGTDQTVLAELGRATKLSITSSLKELQLGAGCQSSVSFDIKNEDSSPQTVELLGTDGLSGLIQATTKTVAANTIDHALIRITAPKSVSENEEAKSVLGSVRIRYTRKEAPLTIQVTETTDVDINPQRIIDRVQPGQILKQLFEIQNRARRGDIRDLTWVTTGDIVKFTTAEFTDNEPLKPEEKKILTAVITIPSNQPPGKMVGTILIGTSCKTYPIPVELDVVQPDFS